MHSNIKYIFFPEANPYKKQKPARGWFISCCVGRTFGGEIIAQAALYIS